MHARCHLNMHEQYIFKFKHLEIVYVIYLDLTCLSMHARCHLNMHEQYILEFKHLEIAYIYIYIYVYTHMPNVSIHA
jgi:hypothetical protein